ncbi:acetyl-CoA acetyltransferase [Kocuria flava]|uniref:Acetyl-CoA acetyltransferase n=1 Tax=Kocuria flava TaxID=446860 RepID=A0A0U3G7L5_9MICC|nr:thiolase family protein [Kocuria flava]ALU39099.1 acetyl-CoA acetyltransferase [Kocuria flava]GEO90768.1 acetyl-CoA acetyltransferase [Kocuria flava]
MPVPSTEPGAPLLLLGRRTPLARAGTALAGVPVHRLLAPVLDALLEETGLAPEQVADVVVGNAVGAGGNPARLAALEAGLPQSVPGLTVDRQCGSGLDAVVLACHLARAGAGRAFLAGGAESISTAPLRGRRQEDGGVAFYRRAQFAPEHLGDPDMGEAAETVAREHGIGRERQDAFALRSHRRALAAAAAGAFAGELVPVRTPRGAVTADNGPRPRLDAALLARFPPVFAAGGTVTAGNSCGDADGAAAVLVADPAAARELGTATALAFRGAATVGVDPARLGLGAAVAARRLLAEQAVPVRALAAAEFNEAFAGQVLACTDLLGLDEEVLNAEGGALALGHAYGASGAVSVVRLLARARELPEGSLLLAMISSAGGIGTAALFEKVAL